MTATAFLSANIPLFLGNLRGWEILIIIVVILLLFGAKKLPELMRNMGKGVNSFRQGMRDMQDEIKKGPDAPESDDSAPTPSESTTEKK